MAQTTIEIVKTLPKANKTSILVVGLTSDKKELSLALPKNVELDNLKNLDFKLFAATEIIRLPNGPTVAAAVKLPEAKTVDSIRELGGTIARQLGDFTELVLALDLENRDELLALAEGISLGNYSFAKFKSNGDSRKLKGAKILSPLAIKPDELQRIRILSETVHEVRDLINTPANLLYPSALANWAVSHSKKYSVQAEVWDEKRLAKEKCGGILAVGQGSQRPPRLIKLTHKPRGAKFKLALVGKGITFDTGGLSLKPAVSMAGMKYDMTGAASVLNAVIAIARLKLPIEVTAWACVAENMPSGSATRPNDVITARNGKTIEVMNTDAEGRVVLADGLSLASETKPDLIVDLATLTGAASVALGNRYAGLMGDEHAVKLIQQAAESAGELVWHMPLPRELRAVLDSPIADIANAKLGNTAGGMLIGGLFLQEFVGSDSKGKQLSWAHLDIASSANNDKEPYGYVPKGGTGVLIRSLVSLAESLAR